MKAVPLDDFGLFGDNHIIIMNSLFYFWIRWLVLK